MTQEIVKELEALLEKYREEPPKPKSRAVWFPICADYETAQHVRFYDVDPNNLPKYVGKDGNIAVLRWVEVRIDLSSYPGVVITTVRVP